MSKKITVPAPAAPSNTAKVVRQTTKNPYQSFDDTMGGTNGTVYKNDPVTGGSHEIILSDIYVRSPIRIKYEIDTWQTALKAAEMRQYPNRTRLYDIYNQVLLDGHLTGVISKRILSVINQQITYQNASGEEIEEMTPIINSAVFRRIMTTIMETPLWGVSGIEFIPGKQLAIRTVPRKHIHPKTQIISVEQNIQDEGWDYTKLDKVWIIIDDPEYLGLLNQCTGLVLYKRGAISDWSNFIEIFGQPVRVAKYDPFDAGTESKLQQLGEETGNLLFMMIPKTVDFEIMDGKSANGNGDLQSNFVKAMNDEISIIVLGNSETTGNSGTGSQAKSKTHSDQQKELIKADIYYLQSKLNDPHFIKILQSYGLPLVQGGKFNVTTEVDIAYAAQKVLIDTTHDQRYHDVISHPPTKPD